MTHPLTKLHDEHRNAWRLLGTFTLISLSGTVVSCKFHRGDPGSAAATTASAADNDAWSPRASLDRCRRALEMAERAEPGLRQAGPLMMACSMIRAPRCRKMAERYAANPATADLGEMLDACARDYCSEIDGTKLAGCRTPPDYAQDALKSAWPELRAAMLRHDFSGLDLAKAASALEAVERYVSSIPPPVFPELDDTPTAIPVEVRIKMDGAVEIKSGTTLVTANANSSLPRQIFPNDCKTTRILLRPEHGTPHEHVIKVMDELRSFGCERLVFGPVL